MKARWARLGQGGARQASASGQRGVAPGRRPESELRRPREAESWLSEGGTRRRGCEEAWGVALATRELGSRRCPWAPALAPRGPWGSRGPAWARGSAQALSLGLAPAPAELQPPAALAGWVAPRARFLWPPCRRGERKGGAWEPALEALSKKLTVKLSEKFRPNF